MSPASARGECCKLRIPGHSGRLALAQRAHLLLSSEVYRKVGKAEAPEPGEGRRQPPLSRGGRQVGLGTGGRGTGRVWRQGRKAALDRPRERDHHPPEERGSSG